ncbi:hypothetical protein IKE82_01470 [Candidatus Saccharibacteria bacterium]|nr:hypothetical protein [Candidatus Saccharibacteria bacterium]
MAKNFRDITWQAEEYIVRSRNTWWYVGLFIVGAGLAALSIFLQWWTFLVLIILCIIAILTSRIKPPRKITYTLTSDGLKEGNRLHPFADFKAFGILKEEGHYSAILIPKKRFGLSIKVYFPEGSGEAIVDALGARLPMQPVKLDFLDKIVNFLRI